MILPADSQAKVMTPELPENDGSLIPTELVFIDSSPINIAHLPRARVLRRKDNHYMLPRSPLSPTLNFRPKAGTCKSDKQTARTKRDYVLANGEQYIAFLTQYQLYVAAFCTVSELEVEPIQLCDTLSGYSLPPGVLLFGASWQILADRTYILARAIEMTKAPLFDPSKHYTTSFSQLHSLDMLPANGLAESDFWKLFSQCKSCHRLMSMRTIPFHICPVSGWCTSHTPVEFWKLTYYSSTKIGTEFSDIGLRTALDNVLQNRAHFIWLLDTHNSDHATGVPENVFQSIFYLCSQCGRYMTRRVSREHYEDADCGDYAGCINLRPANNSEAAHKAKKTSSKMTVREFPTLPPLSH